MRFPELSSAAWKRMSAQQKQMGRDENDLANDELLLGLFPSSKLTESLFLL
jgi:hypothetical protein